MSVRMGQKEAVVIVRTMDFFHFQICETILGGKLICKILDPKNP